MSIRWTHKAGLGVPDAGERLDDLAGVAAVAVPEHGARVKTVQGAVRDGGGLGSGFDQTGPLILSNSASEEIAQLSKCFFMI